MKALIALLLAAVVVSLVIALPVMCLLNWIIAPSALLAVFGTAHVGFWQAYGIAILSSCLFGGTRVSTSNSK